MTETVETLSKIVTELAKKVEAVRQSEGSNGERTEKKADAAVSAMKDIKQEIANLTKRVAELEKGAKKR